MLAIKTFRLSTFSPRAKIETSSSGLFSNNLPFPIRFREKIASVYTSRTVLIIFPLSFHQRETPFPRLTAETSDLIISDVIARATHVDLSGSDRSVITDDRLLVVISVNASSDATVADNFHKSGRRGIMVSRLMMHARPTITASSRIRSGFREEHTASRACRGYGSVTVHSSFGRSPAASYIRHEQ